MDSRIVCYRLEAKKGPRTLSLPVGAEPLSATYHNGALGLWMRLLERPKPSPKEPAPGGALEAEAEVFEPHIFELVETGDVVTGRHRYLGTGAAPGGTFCMHVLQRLEPGDVERHPERTLAQRLEGLEDDVEEIADNLRSRLEGLESPAGESIADIASRIEALSREMTTQADRLSDNLEDLGRELRPRLDELERRVPS